MRTSILTSSILAIAFCATPALADDHHDHDRGRDHGGDRDRGRDYDRRDHGDRGGRVDHRAPHPAYTRTPPRFHGHLRFDPRPAYVIRNDPHFHIGYRNYRPHHAWGRYHLSRGRWFSTWGVSSWNDVGTVTCEAVDQDTGQMYPVSADRADVGWDSNAINALLDQALDDCYADGGGGACTPVTPSCTASR